MNTTFKVKQSIYYEKKCNAPVIAWKNKKKASEIKILVMLHY